MAFKNKSIMKLIIAFLMINSLLMSCNRQDKFVNKTAINSPKLRLLIYGLPNFKKQNALNVMANKWEIEFYRVANCTITKRLKDSVEQNNYKIKGLIAAKFGTNWEDKFYEEVEKEFEKEEKIINKLKKLDYIKQKEAQMAKDGLQYELFYFLTPIAQSNKYDVVIGSLEDNQGELKWVTYYQLKVNYKTEKIIK